MRLLVRGASFISQLIERSVTKTCIEVIFPTFVMHLTSTVFHMMSGVRVQRMRSLHARPGVTRGIGVAA